MASKSLWSTVATAKYSPRIKNSTIARHAMPQCESGLRRKHFHRPHGQQMACAKCDSLNDQRVNVDTLSSSLFGRRVVHLYCIFHLVSGADLAVAVSPSLSLPHQSESRKRPRRPIHSPLFRAHQFSVHSVDGKTHRGGHYYCCQQLEPIAFNKRHRNSTQTLSATQKQKTNNSECENCSDFQLVREYCPFRVAEIIS